MFLRSALRVGLVGDELGFCTALLPPRHVAPAPEPVEPGPETIEAAAAGAAAPGKPPTVERTEPTDGMPPPAQQNP